MCLAGGVHSEGLAFLLSCLRALQVERTLGVVPAVGRSSPAAARCRHTPVLGRAHNRTSDTHGGSIPMIAAGLLRQVCLL